MLYCAQRYRKFKTSLKLTAVSFYFLRTHNPPESEGSVVILQNHSLHFSIGEKLLDTMLDSHVVRNFMFIKNPGTNMVYSEH